MTEYELDISPVVSHIRAYKKGRTYAQRDDYDGIVTVQWLSKTKVYLSGLQGIASSTLYTQCMKLLKRAGVKTVSFERDGEIIEVDL